MKCSVFIATSFDGYIATSEGSVDWLSESGNLAANMADNADMGFNAFMASVDCMVMGRKTMEKISNMNLTPEQWPYGDIPIVVLTNTLKTAPSNLADKVRLYSGDMTDLMKELEKEGLAHAYIDGGATITSFLNQRLIDEITITQAPVLLGEGISLFGKLAQKIKLTEAKTKAFANDFIQISYKVIYS